jgi:hypothetical protein
VVALSEPTEFDADPMGQMAFGTADLFADQERLIAAEVEPRHLGGLEIAVPARECVHENPFVDESSTHGQVAQPGCAGALRTLDPYAPPAKGGPRRP